MRQAEPDESVATLKQLAATDLELVRVLADRDILDENALPIRIRRLLEHRRKLRSTLPH